MRSFAVALACACALSGCAGIIPVAVQPVITVAEAQAFSFLCSPSGGLALLPAASTYYAQASQICAVGNPTNAVALGLDIVAIAEDVAADLGNAKMATKLRRLRKE
jgi:hypothetical protein